MKRFLVLPIVVLLSYFMMSCSQSSRFESAAKQQMETTFKEIAKDPTSVKIANIETVYSDDSLCILHSDFTAKNGFGNEVTERYEYVYLRSNGKNYEGHQEIKDEEDGIYVGLEKYNKDKKGNIYENLSYEEGLRYLAAVFLNESGREAGVRDGESFLIPVPTGTGAWQLKSYKDEFGEEGSNKYLVLTGRGVFSNSATTNSNMTAFLFIDNDSFSFKLVEYNSSVVKSDDSYSFRIKDSTGEVYDMLLFNSYSSGQIGSYLNLYDKTMKTILENGGVITVSVTENTRYGTPDTYLFKMDVTGYEEAMKFL